MEDADGVQVKGNVDLGVQVDAVYDNIREKER